MKLLTPSEYVHQAAIQARNASKRIYLISMVIADHPETHELMDALKDAAKRGVKVVVAADIFTYGEVSGSFLPVRYYSPNAKLTTKMVKSLRTAGVKFHWLGHGRLSIFNGRTHSKWCVVDDTVYSFGGVNMYGESIHNVDYMFKITNHKIADRLVYEQNRIQKAEKTTTNYPSVTYEVGDEVIHFDGGIITQSVVYKRVCELANEASEILFVSQYCPTGKLARILRKKKASLYYNRPEQAQSFNKPLIILSQFTSGFRSLYKKDVYLHAKFMIFTMKDGSKIAVTGSHNFAYTGVVLGTREIALETKNPAVISQLETFYTKYIA